MQNSGMKARQHIAFGVASYKQCSYVPTNTEVRLFTGRAASRLVQEGGATNVFTNGLLGFSVEALSSMHGPQSSEYYLDEGPEWPQGSLRGLSTAAGLLVQLLAAQM